MPSADAGVDLGTLLMGLAGGLALFLYGMDKMSGALKAVAGERMKAVLARLTSNRVTGALTGAFVTAVIQSSSVTTVMVVGFITAGLMSLSQSIGIIMGANIGTTVTAQIIAFKVTRFALLLIAVGFGMTLVGKRERIRQHGAGILGLGLLFFGMAVMGDAMQPLRSYAPFLDGMAHMASPAIGILAGAAFTALVQSSSATTGIVIVMASQGVITLPAGIALIFGANLGTCVTALLAAIGRPREALRAAIVHVLYNLAGVLLWLGFIEPLAQAVVAVSPAATELQGAARLAADTPRQIANAHTIFNLANTVLMLGFSTQFARLVEWMVPDRPLEQAQLVRAKYLDSELLSTPALALDRVRLELLHMGDQVQRMLQAILPALLTGEPDALEEVARMDDKVDALHGQIVVYLGRVSQVALTDAQTQEFLKLMEAVNSLENIGDVIETNLVALGIERVQHHVAISAATEGVITTFHAAVSRGLQTALQAVTQKNPEAAQVVIEMKSDINRLADSAAAHQAERLIAEEPGRVRAYKIETDILQNLKRVFYFAKRMARAAVPGVTLNGGP
ncbi:MAG: Na/Pi cotransporter family protein [Planctomycetota bacterium]|nr:MAG: Na/Pi cotransporter family protein [Planctomycetota bacterium]